MSTITVTAKTLDLALIRAAGQLGISSDKVGHNVMQESGGFLGLGKKVIIEAWNKAEGAPRRSGASSSTDRAQTERQPLSSSQIDNLVTELSDFLAGMATLTTGEETKVTAEKSPERLVLNIHSEEIAGQFVKNSKLAESFEHLIRKKPRHLKQELPFRVFVDANNVRVERETELAELAKNFSDQVFEEKKPVVLNYRSSYDRKVIHMALDKDDRVYTKSIGKGPNRKLMILPSKGQEAGGASAN